MTPVWSFLRWADKVTTLDYGTGPKRDGFLVGLFCLTMTLLLGLAVVIAFGVFDAFTTDPLITSLVIGGIVLLCTPALGVVLFFRRLDREDAEDAGHPSRRPR
jgi:hypothetical protein